MIKKISHIGIAVKDLDEAIKFYQSLGLTLESIEEVPSQKVKVAFFPLACSRIELLMPTSEDSPVAKFIEKKGEGIHHLAFAVDDLKQSLSDAEAEEIQLIDKEPRLGAHGADIAFLHPKSSFGTLLEFCKEKH
jgi:methylmalonyl-CoA/ethylmalonyl-CoA epimerase